MDTPSADPRLRDLPFSALRKTLRDGYGLPDLRADALAGLVVGIVALPLSMALAIASGVPPQHGLYTAIVGGFVIAALGGSRVQVSGPTAAFVIVLAPVAAQFGLGGLLVATAMAGGLLVLFGLARLGRLVQFVPYPVTTGFTAGIGVVIATLQMKDLLGLSVVELGESFPARVRAMALALPTTRPTDVGIGLFTLALLLLWPKLVRRIPAPIVALPVAALVALLVARLWPDAAPATIASRFSFSDATGAHAGIPRTPPVPMLPWNLPGPDGAPLHISLELLRALSPSALAIATLGAIESLLSAVVADGMIRRKHDPDAELIAQGVGNLIVPFFGGIAATGAIARTATGVRSGSRSPVASMVHALFVLGAVLGLAPLLGYVPMASLAALLIIVAWNMSEARHVVRTIRRAPRSDVLVLLTCFVLTVVFDMTVSIAVGMVLAAFLFMRRMAEVAGVALVAEPHRVLDQPLPDDVLLYEISGPLFFGAAHKAMTALNAVRKGTRGVIIDLRSVPAIDATGLVNLESAVTLLTGAGTRVVLVGLKGQPLRALEKAGWGGPGSGVVTVPDFAGAIAAIGD